MIVDQTSTQTSKDKAGLERDEAHSHPPPPAYTPHAEPPADAGAPDAPAFTTKPTNFLSLVSTHDDIRGEFAIDPALQIPPAVLPPTDGARANLSLRSQHGAVCADVWVLGRPAAPEKRAAHTTVVLDSGHGSIRVRLHALGDRTTPPLALTATAPHGTVALALPRGFAGMLSLATQYGSIALGDALARDVTQLGQFDAVTRRYFVGELGLLGDGAWGGAQVTIRSSHGKIRVMYVDEAVVEGRKKGLMSWLLGK